jgi:hypothetical protein
VRLRERVERAHRLTTNGLEFAGHRASAPTTLDPTAREAAFKGRLEALGADLTAALADLAELERELTLEEAHGG